MGLQPAQYEFWIMARVGWINPTAGISGDMCLGALVDLGADPDAILHLLGTLAIRESFGIEFRSVLKSGIRATYADVKVAETNVHRGLFEIASIIDNSGLTDGQKDLSKRIFQTLAEAEARVHLVPVEKVRLHEVGSLDAIIDICGFAIAMEQLGIEKLYISPPALGRGLIQGAHGKMAVPAPAVLELLKGKSAYGGPQLFETTTPTGAAIIASEGIFVDEMPSMTIVRIGYGAGTRDSEEPNVLQVVIGDEVVRELNERLPPGHYEKVVELSTNLDDVSGEVAGYLISRLMDKGATDVFIAPTLAKKHRPGMLLIAVVNHEGVGSVSNEMFRLTGTLGIRSQSKERYVLDRDFFEIALLGEKISVKTGPYRAKVEFDQLVSLADKHGVSIFELERMAQAEIEKHLDTQVE